MLKTTRTRLTLTTLERRDTPTQLAPIDAPYTQAEIVRVGPVDSVAENDDAIKLEVKSMQSDTVSQSEFAIYETAANKNGAPDVTGKIDKMELLHLESPDGASDKLPATKG